MKNLRVLEIHRCPLVGMPVGIGKLTKLQILSKFVVGEENKYAHISELKHLDFLSGYLKIYGLCNVTNAKEAFEANSKQKKDIKHMKLQWGKLTPERDVNVDVDVNVLEALQPPTGINGLELNGYPGAEYSKWMMLEEKNMSSFPELTFLFLASLKKCTRLPRLIELPSLRHLWLSEMDSLRSFTDGHPRLIESEPDTEPTVEDLIMVSGKKPETGKAYELVIHQLIGLPIRNYSELKHRPPPLTSLVDPSQSEIAKELLEGSVDFCNKEASFKDKKFRASRTESLPECPLLEEISSLERRGCYNYEVDCIPIIKQHLSSLLEMRISRCNCFYVLGNLKSLERRSLCDSTSQTCLQRRMQWFSSLQSLVIQKCPELEKRCELESGEEWYLISHIPDAFIW